MLFSACHSTKHPDERTEHKCCLTVQPYQVEWGRHLSATTVMQLLGAPCDMRITLTTCLATPPIIW